MRERIRRLLSCLFIIGLIGLVFNSLLKGEDTAQENPPSVNSGLVYIIPIKGSIMDRGLPYFVKRSVKLAKQAKAALIIFEINTPGGAVAIGEETYTLGICKAIDNAAPITTVAYVADYAISAGVLVSIACDKIVMQPEGIIGASEVVGAEAHQEKYTSAFRAMFEARAEKKGYPPYLIMAMVDKDLEVIEVEIDGKRDFLTPAAITMAENEGKDVERIGPVEGAEKGKLLTLTAKRAKKYGLATAIVQNRAEIPPIFAIHNPIFKETNPTWSERFVIFVTSPMVSAILMLVGMISIGMAFKMPGFGVPEGIAITCFVILFFGHYLVGLAAFTEILLFLLGITLLAVEIFLIPGFGVAGISGMVLILVSFVLAMQDFTLPSGDQPWQWQILQRNFTTVAIAFALAIPIFILIIRFLPRTPFFSRLILTTEEQSKSGFTVSQPEYQGLIGKQGIVFTALRPSGKIKIGDDTIDVIAEGDFINKGEMVQVIRVEGQRIIVSPSPRPSPPRGEG